MNTDGREPVVDASQRSSRAIRRIAPDGLVTTLAGDGISGRGGVDDPRFQAGLDIAAPAGTSVLAVREGVVTQVDGVSAFDTLNEAIRVGPIAHLHLRVGRDANGGPFDDVRFVPTWDATGRLARMRVRRGARFQTGDRLGTVYGGEFRSLNVRVFERHDLALAKLGRNQDYEREDVRRLAHGPGLDVALLEQRYRDELRRQLGNSEREDPTLKAVDRDDQRGEQPLRRRAIACKCAATTPHATASSPYERAVAQFAEGLP